MSAFGVESGVEDVGGLAAGDAGAALAGTVAAGATVAGDTGAAIFGS
ncbi:MAG: hypothetical protein WCC95_22350 [Candidatus Sulfotelmatobacter sp.]